MFVICDELGPLLNYNDFTVTWLPDPDGNDYFVGYRLDALNRPKEAIEVQCRDGGRAFQAVVTPHDQEPYVVCDYRNLVWTLDLREVPSGEVYDEDDEPFWGYEDEVA